MQAQEHEEEGGERRARSREEDDGEGLGATRQEIQRGSRGWKRRRIQPDLGRGRAQTASWSMAAAITIIKAKVRNDKKRDV